MTARPLALALLLAAGALPCAAAEAFLDLPDGRRVRGERLRSEGEWVVLETAFGPLRVPRASVAAEASARPRASPPAPGARRVRRTRWLTLEHDLSPEREALYADGLDAFIEWMVGVYGMDREALRKRAPFPVHVYRSRLDFKEVQAKVAPGIASSKGQGFAEGVAGFHSGAGTYLWDAEGERGDPHLGVAQHEVTHLLNGLFAASTGTRFPVWFEEGSATYFMEAVSLGGKEPEDDAGSIALVLGDLDAGKPYGTRAIRAVPYATFHGREYSWGWALVRFLRRDRGGARWKPFLEFQRSASGGPPADSEEKRFLKAVGFRSSEEMDRAWHAHLVALRGAGGGIAGTSDAALAEIEAMAKPTPEQARTFARIGISLAEREMDREAVVYLRAAMRGQAADGRACALLATSEARRKGLGENDPWPEDLVALLREAVGLEPLRASLRRDLGARLLRNAKSPTGAKAARDALGLALLLAGPDDDRESIAMEALAAAMRAEPALTAAKAAEWFAERIPEAAGACRRAVGYALQAEQRWDELASHFEGRQARGEANPDERAMLAGLYRAGGRNDEAAAIYGDLLEADPAALHWWPARVACLAAAGKREEALRAREEGLRAVDAAGNASAWVREEIERVPIE